ncbi:N-acetylneuraminate synthase family protein [Rhabdaerophilum calidifontis]|uniref:N-acetylneuraminate synthase family protein n=1 Tax=Rhabdaerophilum calidifontis TaxID=2604328 RepID=UPI001238CABA|nr:N-acetylneuraminate synthase family protein [Rhabdaerophilum calidifontis]
MRIGPVDLTQDVLVIAEIGNNHEGDVGLAEELVHLAAEAGAQAVKFQSIEPRALVAPDQPERLAQLGRFALPEAAHHRLAEAARRAGVMFLSTPFSLGMVDFLAPIAPALKIASGDNDFLPLLERAAGTGLPLILSTGMADLAMVARSKAAIEAVWARSGVDPGLVLLHCVSAYPTPVGEANLAAIRTLAALGRPVGYSDHTLGIAAAILAVGLGARVIEKHFTRSKTQSAFRDHQLSAEPAELREMVARIREANALLGDGVKRAMPAESGSAARRSIAASRDLPAGHVLAFADLAWLRPGGGLPPGAEAAVLGRRLKRAVAAGARLSPADIED